MANTGDWIFYSTASFIGYFSFLNKTPKLIINRENLMGGSDYFMLFGKLIITIDLLGSYLVS